MAWIKYIYTLLFAFLLSCNSGTKEYLFEFGAAWVYPTEYKIDLRTSTLTMHSFEYFKPKDGDSTITHLKNQFKISPENLAEFIEQLEEVELKSSCVNGETEYLDGFAFRFNKIDFKKDTVSLTSHNPIRNENFGIDYKILDAFFPLANKTIGSYPELSITENIQDYLSYGLPIKKIGENPSEYRVWGTVGCAEMKEELIDFLDSLPMGKPIIFDTRNGRFLYCSSELLKEHSNKQIYFYGSFELEQTLKQIEESERLLEIAHRKYDISNVGRTKVIMKDEIKYKNEIIQAIKENPNHFLTKEEILKTIGL